MRKALLIVFAILLGLSSDAQFYNDWGVMLGVSTHKGDINRSKTDFAQGSDRKLAIGGFYRHKFSSLLSGRGQIMWSRLSGDDAISNEPSRIARNLNFRTDIIELAAIGEVHAMDIKDFGRTGRYTTFFNLYGFAGVGLTYYNPQGERSNGEWVSLRPLQTEGEKYSPVTVVFPMGIGSHMTFNRKYRIGLELGYRFTMTDYLDDVSGQYMTNEQLADITDEVRLEMQNKSDQAYIDANPDYFGEGYVMGNGGIRGGPDVNDSYFFGTVNFGYMIRGKSNFYRARYQFTRGKKHKKRRSRAKF